MTKVRQILPGSFYLVTRRCAYRQFLVRPGKITNQIIRFALAVASEKTGVEMHAVCFMSNHWHGVVSDPDGRLPEFLREVNALIASALNIVLDRSEALWSSKKPSVVRLMTEADVLDKMAYVIVNPTRAGLVKSPSEWPGVITHHLGESQEVEMPDVFFDEDGELDDSAVLTFARPCIFSDLSDLELNQKLADEVARRVRLAKAQRFAEGKSFLGAAAVLQQSPFGRPISEESNCAIHSEVACGDNGLRARAINALKEFRRVYRETWSAWRSGESGCVFPAGTYGLRIYAGVKCELLVPI